RPAGAMGARVRRPPRAPPAHERGDGRGAARAPGGGAGGDLSVPLPAAGPVAGADRAWGRAGWPAAAAGARAPRPGRAGTARPARRGAPAMRGQRLLAASCAVVVLAGCTLPWSHAPAGHRSARPRPTPVPAGAQFTLDGSPASGSVTVSARSLL